MTKSHSELIEAAWAARAHAWAPYSGFKVGAAVLAGGKVFAGANVENSSYGDSICAEKVAIACAVTAGHRDISEIAIAAATEEPPVPCGSCRQVMAEFDPQMKLILVGRTKVREATLADLFPEPFDIRKG
jgi:cytidine deaminase